MSREALIETLVVIVLASWAIAFVCFAGLLVWGYIRDWVERRP